MEGEKQDESPPPPYTAVNTSFNLGLRKLAYLEQVYIRQTATMLTIRSAVTTADGELIFHVKEHSTVLEVELGGQIRAFNIGLYDEREQLAITLKRDHKVFRKKKVQVFVGEELVSKVRLKRAIFGRMLHINNVRDETVFVVRGPLFGLKTYTFKLHYQIATTDGQPIGSIIRLWRGIGNELLSDTEGYQLNFPRDLDVRHKAAVIGTCILIDIHFYSTYIRNLI